MREGREVDGGEIAAARDARRAVDPAREGGEDGVAGGVLRVDDAALAVAALAGEVELARRVAVEVDVQFVEEELLHRDRALADELVDGGGVGRAVARGHDILRELGGIGARVVDDAALGPVAVGAERFAEGEELDLEAGAGGVPRVGGAGEAGPEDEAVGVDDAHGVSGGAAR